MKLKVTLVIFLLINSLASHSQSFIKIDAKKIMQSNNLDAARPKFNYDNYKIEDYEKIKQEFKFLREETQIQFNYPQGNCHNRAELMSMYLKKHHISHFKIWNFAPSKFSLLNALMLEVKDNNDFAPTGVIKWGYHVAPTVLTKIHGKLDTVVLDPSLFAEPVNFKKWLAVQNCKESFYTFLNPDWYLFYTMNGLTVSDYEDYDLNCKKDIDMQLPGYLPKLMTGDFYSYNPTSKWLEKGMAINEMAYKFYLNELLPLKKDPTKQDLIKEYKTLFGSVNNIESIMLGYESYCKIDKMLLEKHKALIEKYRKIFEDETNKWLERTKDLY
ncbi:protein-glutamine glutaminase family protein [Mucilaginibacter pedocola]|uniref:Protein glutaminase domain-containing protein n=1 Tax=Mucilaginibacter pedocola TaxID=1792845 RepID=A0A1S9PMQ1_9SPHI|nr:protein-glutamine glutaminase family protein [Mucilaginibacter pedocola]OOQ62209.1 hypothetical protein BC343_03970 [Mucilaginibacter pedocola]